MVRPSSQVEAISICSTECSQFNRQPQDGETVPLSTNCHSVLLTIQLQLQIIPSCEEEDCRCSLRSVGINSTRTWRQLFNHCRGQFVSQSVSQFGRERKDGGGCMSVIVPRCWGQTHSLSDHLLLLSMIHVLAQRRAALTGTDSW